MEQPDMLETTRLRELYSRRVAARGDGGGNSCVTPEALIAVVRREGPEADRLATLDHVMACAACHRDYEWLTAVLSGVLRTGAERERGATSDIALVALGARAAAARPLTFTWRALPGVSSYVLEVQRLDGSVAFADTTTDTVLAEPSRVLPDSAYRWWVREVTDGTEPRSSELRELRLTGR